jgi:hypothetical protein
MNTAVCASSMKLHGKRFTPSSCDCVTAATRRSVTSHKKPWSQYAIYCKTAIKANKT